jgi:vacuolar iron transporter family protein
MSEHSHFQGKDALHHVAEKQVQGILTSAESHGPELPDHLSCFSSSLKDTALLYALLSIILSLLSPNNTLLIPTLTLFAIGWVLWRGALSALLSWSHLERLKRLTLEEKHEIENHREQEREELGFIYAAKGFKGELLEQVLDVLMADENRLLKVMLEEELGLTLDKQEHPIKQGVFSALGSLSACILSISGFYFFGVSGSIAASALAVLLSTFFITKYLKNNIIAGVTWNLSIYSLSIGVCYYLTDYFF